MIGIIIICSILLSWINHQTRLLTITDSFALPRQWHILMILFSKCLISCIITLRFHKLILWVQNIDVLEILARLLNHSLLTLRTGHCKTLVLNQLTLCLMTVFKMRFWPSDRVLLPLRRANIHHLNLTLGMINCSLLVTLRRIIYNFLTAIGALVPLLGVSRINNLFLISLKHLRGMSSYCATTSLLKAKAAAMFLLGA